MHIASRRLQRGCCCKSRACVYVRLWSSPSFRFGLLWFASILSIFRQCSLAQTETEMHIAVSRFLYTRCNIIHVENSKKFFLCYNSSCHRVCSSILALEPPSNRNRTVSSQYFDSLKTDISCVLRSFFSCSHPFPSTATQYNAFVFVQCY